MNWKQKLVTASALVALIVSAIFAPWISTYTSGTFKLVGTVYAPIWSPPADSYTTYHLNAAPLLCTWALVVIVYFGLFFVLKSKKSKHLVSLN